MTIRASRDALQRRVAAGAPEVATPTSLKKSGAQVARMNWLAMAQKLTSPSTQSGPLEKRRCRRCPTATRVAGGAGAGT